MSKKQQTMKNLAKKAYIATKAMQIIVTLTATTMAAALSYVVLYSDKAKEIINMYLNNEVAYFLQLNPLIAEANTVQETLIPLFSGMVAEGIVVVFILYYLGAIFKSIRNDNSPFDLFNVNCLKKAAFGIIILTFLPFLVEAGVMHLLKMTVVSSQIINLNFLAFAFFFYCLAYVFEYGAELQRQSDETL